MGFDDFFDVEGNHHKHEHYHRSSSFQSNHEHSSYQTNRVSRIALAILRNPTYRVFLILGLLLLLAIVVALVVALFPYLLRVLDFVSEKGISGVIETFWKGNK
ncbi:hypothetical protein SAMN05216323_100662 [Williamwhitmania taraxaci]|uniref:Uncharacterized protein n=1 Tax=Williamwhitmania taraxaci TaxID=1640674 RepID=A0A1G6H374_9BACT|nr:hypothetical protein SAMN05216323_100662 [Williamwhitmania taraxaci]